MRRWCGGWELSRAGACWTRRRGALAEIDAADHIVDDPDFQFRVVQTVFVGQAP